MVVVGLENVRGGWKICENSWEQSVTEKRASKTEFEDV